MPKLFCDDYILAQRKLTCQCPWGHNYEKEEGIDKLMLVKERLIAAREKKGYSQSEVARRLGFSAPSVYCRIENGKKNASLSVATDIAEILDVSLDWLIGKGE